MLIAKKIKILAKYSDFLDVFLNKKTLILLEATKMNQHAIELQKDYQPSYGPIYSLISIELKMLKTYIKTNLVNSFIWPSKSLTIIFIFFVKKQNDSFYLYIDY